MKRIKLYDGYININQNPKRAFNSNILHLRKMGKNYYVQSNTKRKIQREEDRSKRSSKSDV